MTKELLSAFLLVFIAEMGDKTQILAMMFATRYRGTAVLMGIFIGSLLNHGLAVLVGATLGNIIPLNMLTLIAGVAFIFFAFGGLKTETDEGDGMRGYKSPVLAVATAFFVGELGDKTQLTAITLSMDAMYPLIILAGTVSAMLVTSSLGIWVGSKIGKYIPEALIKVVSAILFFLFGSVKLYSVFLNKIDNMWMIMGIIIIAGAFVAGIIRFLFNEKEKAL